MKEILKQLGFTYMTGPLWSHPKIGIISVEKDDKPTDIAQKIYNRGFRECQTVIRSSLGIDE